MITFHVSSKPFTEQNFQAYVMLCEQGFEFDNHPIAELTGFYKPLKELLANRGFKGALNSSAVIAAQNDSTPVYLIIVGMGSAKVSSQDRVEHARRAVGNAMRAIEHIKVSSVGIVVPDTAWFASDAFTVSKELAAVCDIATYHFDDYITDEARKFTRDYDITFVCRDDQKEQVKVGVEFGKRIGHAVNQSRYWCDLPPVVLTPTELANQAKRISEVHNLKCTVFTEEQIIKMGMGGIEAVAKGSEQEARFVIMEYKADVPNAQTLALVGKGITFDSGGLSIKPATGMETMKDDMAGGACVISTMEAIAHLKPHINVIGLVPITENLINGHATKPGDIIKFYNGKTAEIKNTDAEGRLILADALAYAAKHYKPDYMITIATLTGSCAYALGPFFAGLMSQDDELANKLLDAGKTSGDRLWPLPFHNDYKPAIQSTVADLCNIGSDKYRAGAITAGFFLKNFVDDIPYVHLDIAGTAFNVPDVSYYRPGATGFGVRLFVELFDKWK